MKIINFNLTIQNEEKINTCMILKSTERAKGKGIFS